MHLISLLQANCCNNGHQKNRHDTLSGTKECKDKLDTDFLYMT